MKPSSLRLENIFYSYHLGEQRVPALNGISLSIEAGEMVAIQGPSGSGKSTLLYLLGCMLKPDSGKILVEGQDVSLLSEVELAYFRNRKIGFVFQQFHLLPSADVLGNILLPTNYPLEERGAAPDGGPQFYALQARLLAAKLGLEERLDHRPAQLSGGQQQRVAIARALIRDAPLILADEPTGNLDSKTSGEILTLLRELNQGGKTVVIITHDPEVAEKCDRVIWIRDGKVQDGPALLARVENKVPLLASGVSLQKLDWSTLMRESAPRAWDNLKRNKTRSLLTMLGVVVGVASILAMLTLGTFTKAKILQSYATLGINTMQFYAYQNWNFKAIDKTANTFRELDLDRDVWPLQHVFPEIRRLAPVYQDGGHSAIFGGRSVDNDVTIFGVSDNTFQITGREIALGSPILPYHIEHKSSVCVIGFLLAERLFVRINPIGQPIQVAIDDSTFSCQVIGVLKSIYVKDRQRDPDLQVAVPYTYYNELPFYWWNRRLSNLVMEIDDQQDMETVGKKIQGFFTKRYGKSGTFRAGGDSVLIAQMKRFLDLFTLLLVSIAALSLLVGGMGITNMMLVSVNERFREIGLRKALGASHSAIRQLFFAESFLLCGVAGGIGMIIGFTGYEVLIYIGAQFIPDLKFEWVVNPAAVVISFVAILITGVLSGLGPAIRAERLQVIEALRSE